jgi:hypothetical protein
MANSKKVTSPPTLKYLQPSVVNNLIRIGDKTDGGYALSSIAVNRTENLISLGLGENWSFEIGVSRINSCATLEIYDDSVGLKFFITKCMKGLAKFFLFRDSLTNLSARFLRLFSYYKFWHLMSNHRHLMIRINEKSFSEILSKYPPERRLGLKIDIEGSEWEILKIIELNQFRFEFMLIEFHQVDQHAGELREFIYALSQNFIIAHLHANNFEPLGSNRFPNVLELTLLKNSNAVTSGISRAQLPVKGLDAPNAKNRPDFQIKFE